MKRILGLDLGTNSVGWAFILRNLDQNTGEILGSGSRIIPMSKAVMNDFAKGVTKSQTAERTDNRGTRRLYERSNTRRERLHRVLNVLNYLPESYAKYIDFDKKKGQFVKNKEPLLPYSDIAKSGRKRFLFEESYQEMEKEFRALHSFPKMNKKGKPYRLPADWTLFFLRKKALSEYISNQELAWILLNFNQKRGYYQEREEKELKINELKKIEYKVLRTKEFVDSGEKVDGKILFNIIFENDWIYNKPTSNPDIWKDIDHEFIVTSEFNEDGTLKSRSYRKVKEDDWEAVKRKTEQDLGDEFVGKFIYESLLKNPSQKIKGGLIKTIDRDFYFDELEVILRTQLKFRDEWNDYDLYKKAVQELYPNNAEHQNNLLKNKDKFIHLFLRDILFYHRPLKSQKSKISKCTLEYRSYLNENNESVKVGINAIAKSNPIYQEFRTWQLAHNIRIQKKEILVDGKIKLNVDVTSDYIKSPEDFEAFFNFLNSKKEVSQKQVLEYFIKNKKERPLYKWNYGDDDKLKLECNTTRYLLKNRFSKEDTKLYSVDLEQKLWHIIYSVTDKKQYLKAIEKFSKAYNLSNETKGKLEKTPMLKRDYATYSEKAIKRLLTLMRSGKAWNEKLIDDKTLDRIDKLSTGEFDDTISDRVREKVNHFNSINDYQGLPLWLASYIIYGEPGFDIQWQSSHQLKDYIRTFKQHSIRNPIVEQVLLESLRVTLDIWEYYGENYGEKLNISNDIVYDDTLKRDVKSYHKIFDGIHIEIGRDLKNPKKVRERLNDLNKSNQETNQRIRKLLYELKNYDEFKDIHPNSKTHFDKLRIYEQTILSQYSQKELEKEILGNKLSVDKFIKKNQPTSKEVLKYRLWLEQKYQSPYTGKIIPLSDLFTSKYEIEHIIPQSKYIDNSFSNKVICETEVNTLKDNKTAYVFIQEYGASDVPLNGGGFVTISSKQDYERFVREKYSRKKLANLLSESIPQKMASRQKNDMRYISREALKVYSNIVRQDGEKESTVKNVLPVSGAITAKLRAEWGLNKVWSSFVEHRFKRLNQLICGEENIDDGLFGSLQKNGGFFKPEVPLAIRKDFDLKRIDHRHHALDAIIIACTTRQHVNYINNEHSKEGKKRHDIGKILRNTKTIQKTDPITKDVTKRIVLDDYKKPWDSFTSDAKLSLQKIVVSFKQNLRVINKATNYNWRYKNEKGAFLFDKKGEKRKQLVEQTKGSKNWAIRKPLHEDTYFGLIENGEHKDFLVKREPLNPTFNERKIKNVVDPVVRKILLKHLQKEKYINQTDDDGKKLTPSQVAFSPKGIQEMNDSILDLNNNVFHHPIKKVRIKHTKGKQFSVRRWTDEQDNLIKETKFVKSASGTNLYFCIYEKEGDRKYYVPNFEEILETQKSEAHLKPDEKTIVPTVHPKNKYIDYKFKFYLQPNDIVYVPESEGEVVDFDNLSVGQIKRIYKFTDGSGTTANFIPMLSASVIYNLGGNKTADEKRKIFSEEHNLCFKDLIKNEYGLGSPQLKNQNTTEGIQVKSICWKLITDRLGNIIQVVK